jgi:hypothetical protein
MISRIGRPPVNCARAGLATLAVEAAVKARKVRRSMAILPCLDVFRTSVWKDVSTRCELVVRRKFADLARLDLDPVQKLLAP